MLKISFDFDEITQKVSNVKVTSEKKESNSEYDLKVDENKLELTIEATEKLGAVAGDRVAINYWTVDNETTYPIISKADLFTDGADGNKITKKCTISFKGQQRTSLLKFGSLFTFSEFKDKNGVIKDNVFVLTPLEDQRESVVTEEFQEEKEIAKELDNNTLENEIAAMLGENDEDVLPF